MTRDRVSEAKRVVVKIGSTSLTHEGGRLDPSRVDVLVSDLVDLLADGRELVCVTSGAVAAGLEPLGLSRKPTQVAKLQAAAAVGQSHLMDAYQTAFESRGRVCGQVLLTRSDFLHRGRYVNAQNTFNTLLGFGAVPVVNENDTIATDEIRFGENDLLAALVANLVGADVLVLLSDVDGLHDGGADGPLIDEIDAITPEIDAMAGGSRSGLGSGGMRSKLDAARIATASGVSVVIARARDGVLKEVLGGDQIGTLFHAASSKLTARKAWIGYASTPTGTVVVDAGARKASPEKPGRCSQPGSKPSKDRSCPGTPSTSSMRRRAVRPGPRGVLVGGAGAPRRHVRRPRGRPPRRTRHPLDICNLLQFP